MNHDEATVYFDALGESVAIRPPSTADLIGAGRAAHRRRTRATLFGVVVAVALVLGGGAVVRGVGGGGGEGQRLSETVVEVPLAPDGKRLVGMGRVAVEVPESWVAESNGCEDTLGPAIYVHEPGPLGDRSCGGVSSVVILSTESATGRALGRYPLDERTVGGVDVRVGDSCLPTAACIYPYGRIVTVPSEDVVLLVSAGTRHDEALLADVESSLQLLPEGLTTVPHVDPGTMADEAEEVVEGAGLDAILDVPDLNLAVEGTNPSGGSVVRVGSTVEILMPPVSDYAPDMGSMRADPRQAAPGDVVALTFPGEEMRGVGFVLTDTTTRQSFALTSDGGRAGASPSWTQEPGNWVDIGVGGPGPDRVIIPEIAPSGDYVLCTANAARQMCTSLTIS